MSYILVAVIAGLIAGTLDIVYAITLAKSTRKVPPVRLLQYIASGIYGKSAYLKGNKGAAYGLIFHYIITVIMAITFFIAAQRFPVLVSQPLLYGPLYGLLLFVVMIYGVIPLSQTFPKNTPKGMHLLFEILAHMFLVGLPIALLASLA